MHSICYVVLPDNLTLNDTEVYTFIRNHIMKYYSELEVEPYKKFFSEKETLEISKKKGFDNLVDFEEYLQKHNNDDGIENGLYYWITTYNLRGRWDYFGLDGVKLGYELQNDELPYSVVTPDGVWHSERDFGYKPILDFENNFKIHPLNEEPERMWKCYLLDFFTKYHDFYLAVIDVHS